MQRINRSTWIVLLAALLLPLVSMIIVPLYDTSEPRYAEIARIMAQSGDWITPWFSPELPFWGKPPLSFWAQALSMKLFGFTEFAARFPSWLCLILSNAILLAGLRLLHGLRIALLATIVYSTCLLVYISSGAVLTDPFLALGTTLSLISFAVVIHESGQRIEITGNLVGKSIGVGPARGSVWWQYGFFLGLAVGLLAKGPLAAVLSLAPIAVWYLLNRRRSSLVSALPWLKGLALVAAISLPWYIVAELKTPGFLDYFIVGEHFRRFLDPGWKGDLYGTAHKQAYGTIWLYWLQASFPWGTMLLATLVGAFVSTRLRAAVRIASTTSLFYYWLAGAVVTPLFFTFSANILWTYVLPSLAGFSVLTAILADHIYRQLGLSKRGFLITAGVVPVAVLVLSAVVWVNPDLRNTERELIRYASQDGDFSIPLVYLSKTPFSAQFYSAGKAREIQPSELGSAIKCSAPFYLAIPKERQSTVENMTGKPLIVLYSNKRYVLVKVSPLSNCSAQAIAKQQPISLQSQHLPNNADSIIVN
ncbi:glycosyltransferase family 39 protein [Pusillimonas sp. CC-YST705]|uniref:Glycosyltransferase family 39 protein n=1 Tax=Mesopusillimonas faecipullorum TaxID=2755040 RepID=A0ABS8C8J5_9BURK|nr:glycosyltransferase family 39 protein [Mesopusillimonas faecipullorum]MCB5362339.1 glycosyltransferase family 39 protein [Mesopusillimonas faecipullorum]